MKFVSFALCSLVVAAPARAGDRVPLRGGETIIFFGDSITQAGHYVNDFEALLLKAFPSRPPRVINHGISSETLSGLSEPNHDPPRPCALERFTRDVASWKPDVVVACFGMNDGIYHPFDAARFAAFQRGVRTLIERTRTELPDAWLVLATPPPFDPYRRVVSDPDAIHFGYRYPAIDYDDVLARYSDWMRQLNEPRVVVVDCHAELSNHLEQARAIKASAFLSADGVHPGREGHRLMALCITRGFDSINTAPPTPDERLLDRLEQRNANRYNLWRQRINSPDPADDQDLPQGDAEATSAIMELLKQGRNEAWGR